MDREQFNTLVAAQDTSGMIGAVKEMMATEFEKQASSMSSQLFSQHGFRPTEEE